MLKSGDIVVQEFTMVNNKNYKDNKKNRLSVVVFEDVTENGSVVYILRSQPEVNEFLVFA